MIMNSLYKSNAANISSRYPLSLVPERRHTITVGDDSSEYVLCNLQVIADGTNAIISKANFNNNHVVIKKLKEKYPSQHIAVREINIEAQALKCCNHPNIINIHGAGDDCILVEHLPNGTLFDYFQRESQNQKAFLRRISRFFDSSRNDMMYMQIAIALAAGMKYLHEDVDENACFIHRGLID